MGDAVHQGKAAQEVLDWVENLQKHGLCVVLVHHKSEYETIAPQKDKARGSQLFIIRARTVIGLVNKKEILDESLGAAAVQKSALQDGLTIGIRYQVSKPAPILEGKTFWLYLPLGASEWTFLAATGHGSKEIDFFPSEAPTLTQSDGSQASSTDSAREAGGMSETEEASMADGLTEDQHKLYEYANRYSEISTGNAAKRLNCGETKAREVLKSLVEQGLLEDNGKKGPALAYHLKK